MADRGFSAEKKSISSNHCALLIPAYQPSEPLLDLIRQLSLEDHPFIVTVVVDDGSGPECEPIFRMAGAAPGTVAVRHPKNRGKGAALKTGLDYIASNFPACTGVVTADADGQHAIPDILAVAGALIRNPQSLVMGTR